MKRLLTVMLLTLSWALTWADSPLTSSDFAESYKDQPMVQMALKLSDDSDASIPVSMLNYLADKKSPVDVRLAVINAIGWNFNGKTAGQQLYEYLSTRYKAKTVDKLAKKLDAGTLAVYAYALAMSNYFEVEEAQDLAHKAVKKDKSKSFSVAFIASLIDAQVHLDGDWGMVYKVVNDVLHNGSLHLDMRQEAIDSVMEYIDLYKEY
ncbi:MAG: hypothetical protein J5790_06035 [Bacteroidaceae bacterium]|nr:hypothetical protein [Bacteroidaceae bacterium]